MTTHNRSYSSIPGSANSESRSCCSAEAPQYQFLFFSIQYAFFQFVNHMTIERPCSFADVGDSIKSNIQRNCSSLHVINALDAVCTAYD